MIQIGQMVGQLWIYKKTTLIIPTIQLIPSTRSVNGAQLTASAEWLRLRNHCTSKTHTAGMSQGFDKVTTRSTGKNTEGEWIWSYIVFLFQQSLLSSVLLFWFLSTSHGYGTNTRHTTTKELRCFLIWQNTFYSYLLLSFFYKIYF